MLFCLLFAVKNERGGVDIRNRPRIPIPDEDPYSVAGTSLYIQLLISTYRASVAQLASAFGC
jgi:hypothetical protein